LGYNRPKLFVPEQLSGPFQQSSTGWVSCVGPTPGLNPALSCCWFTRGPKPRVMFHLCSNRAISTIESMELGTYPLHIGSQVLSPKYDMDAYTAILFGGEGHALCRELHGSGEKLEPTLNTSPEFLLHKIINI
jgi:hypothetical protein